MPVNCAPDDSSSLTRALETYARRGRMSSGSARITRRDWIQNTTGGVSAMPATLHRMSWVSAAATVATAGAPTLATPSQNDAAWARWWASSIFWPRLVVSWSAAPASAMNAATWMSIAGTPSAPVPRVPGQREGEQPGQDQARDGCARDDRIGGGEDRAGTVRAVLVEAELADQAVRDAEVAQQEQRRRQRQRHEDAVAVDPEEVDEHRCQEQRAQRGAASCGDRRDGRPYERTVGGPPPVPTPSCLEGLPVDAERLRRHALPRELRGTGLGGVEP